MNSFIRRLQIYKLINIGDSYTINLNQWIIDTFSDLNKILQLDGNTAYYLKDFHNTALLLQHVENKQIRCNYTVIWKVLQDRFNMDNKEISEVISYITYEYYNITFKPVPWTEEGIKIYFHFLNPLNQSINIINYYDNNNKT